MHNRRVYQFSTATRALQLQSIFHGAASPEEEAQKTVETAEEESRSDELHAALFLRYDDDAALFLRFVVMQRCVAASRQPTWNRPLWYALPITDADAGHPQYVKCYNASSPTT